VGKNDEPLFVLHLALRLLGDIRDDQAVPLVQRRRVAVFLRQKTEDRSDQTAALAES
jgi:hypothetical protein